MYYNFSKLTKTSLSIAWAIISFILTVLFFALGLKYETNVLVGFIMVSFSFISLAVSSIFSFIKCRKFGNDSLKKREAPKDVEDKEGFKKFSNLIAIFGISFVLLFVVGLIIMLA